MSLPENSTLKTQHSIIDCHCHLLPQTDDGAVDGAASLEMATILANAGFTDVCCTPHLIKGVYETEPRVVRARIARLQELLDRAAIRLQLHPGAEYYFDEYLPISLDEPLPLASGCILAEAPPQASSPVIEALVATIIARGFTPLIAHPERTPLFATPIESPDLYSFFAPVTKIFSKAEAVPKSVVSPALRVLLSMGCRLQGNIGSFAGIYGERARSNALALLDEGLYSCLGSDAHRSEQLTETLQAGLTVVRNRMGIDSAAKLLSGELLV